MIRVSDDIVYLVKGESVPVWCNCGHVYQPELDSELSDCPECGRVNVHQVCREMYLIDPTPKEQS
jgi:Zn finger protein HypA/HybF involved in hydrogenase expression